MKSLFFLLGAAALFGAGYLFLVSGNGVASLTAGASGPVTCDWEGVTYAKDDIRASTDGCNTCSCTETGWSCSSLSCVADGEGIGTISGSLRYPGDERPPLRVCAVDPKEEDEYCLQAVPGQSTFALRVPAGDYRVFSDDASFKGTPRETYRAWYSEYLVCGQGAECKDRSPVTVTVEAGKTSAAHPNDWSAPAWPVSFTLTPANHKYGSTYHYNEGEFTVRSKGATEVEVWYLRAKKTAAEPDDTEPKLVGNAARAETGKNGLEIWKLSIPQGFSSSHVWAVVRDENGNFMRSRDLGWVKPDASVIENGP